VSFSRTSLVVGIITGLLIGSIFMYVYMGAQITDLKSQIANLKSQIDELRSHVIVKGSTWYYRMYDTKNAKHTMNPSYSGQSYATIDSDSWSGDVNLVTPTIFQEPGQTRTYNLNFYLNSAHLPKNGRFLQIDTNGLHIKFEPAEINASLRRVQMVEMKITLDEDFSPGLRSLNVPVIFSDEERIQPTSFGPIFLITGRAGSKIEHLKTGGRLLAFTDEAELGKNARGYVVKYWFVLDGATVVEREPEMPCVTLDINGDIHTSYLVRQCAYPYSPSLGVSYLELKPGGKTSFKMVLKLMSNVGVNISLSEAGRMSQPPAERPFTVDFEPNRVSLKPGKEVEVTVTVSATGVGVGTGYINLWAVALEGFGIGVGPVSSDRFIVVIVPQTSSINPDR